MTLLSGSFRNAATALGGLGLLAATVSNLESVVQLRHTHFWSLLLVSWIVVSAGIWPGEELRHAGFYQSRPQPSTREKLHRYRWILATTAATFLVACGHLVQPARLEELDEGEDIIDRTKPIPIDKTSRSGEVPLDHFASDAPASVSSFLSYGLTPLVLLDFGLSAKKTSYEEMITEDGLPEFRLPARFKGEGGVDAPDRWDGCTPFRRNARLMPALRRFVQTQGQQRVLRYLSDEQSLENLLRRRAAILRTIIPSGSDWSRIREPADKEVILDWVRECVGLGHPVFLVALSNPSDAPVVVRAVRYVMIWSDASCDASIPLVGPMVPSEIYSHGLRPFQRFAQPSYQYLIASPQGQRFLSSLVGVGSDRRTGSRILVPQPERHTISPRFVIRPKSDDAFELHVYATTGRSNHYVMMALEIETSAGIVKTPEFGLDFPVEPAC